MLAAGALLFDVSNFAVCRDLAVVSCDAPASECGEPQEANQAHHKQLPDYARASPVPQSSDRTALDVAARDQTESAENPAAIRILLFHAIRRTSRRPRRTRVVFSAALNHDINALDRMGALRQSLIPNR